MTHADAVRRCYNWAWNAYNDKHTPVMTLVCAKEILSVVERYGECPAGFQVLAELLKEWRSSKRQSFELPIKIVANSLSLVDPAQASAAQ